MAKIVTCWFCKEPASEHDHDRCALNYGAPVDERIMNTIRGEGLRYATVFHEKEVNSPNYQAYKKYLERTKRAKLVQAHMDGIKRDVEAAARGLLSEDAGHAKLSVLNKPMGHVNFVVKMTVVAEVYPETVC